MIKILPSILTSDFTDNNKDIDKFFELGLDEIHLDVMDGNFVDAMTYGPKYISDLKSHHSNVIFDCHLMIINPIKHIKDYIDAKADRITVHVEKNSIKELVEMSKMVKEAGISFGLAINPETNIKVLEKVLKKVKPDIILIMSVHPGKGGQAFIPEVLEKANKLISIKENGAYSFDLEIDGGINLDNLKTVIEHKIERIVAGSLVYKGLEFENNLNDINEKIKLIAGN